MKCQTRILCRRWRTHCGGIGDQGAENSALCSVRNLCRGQVWEFAVNGRATLRIRVYAAP